jgi:hypothetical protein
MKKLLAMVLTVFMASAWAAQPTPAPSPAPAAASLQGEVLESQDADVYTYLRLKTKGGEVWAAVQKTPVKKGTLVTIQNPMLMTNFESKALNRKFDKIVFGTLAGAPGATAAGAAGNPHADPSKAIPTKPVEKVAKATGPDARTVAEVFAQKAQLKGKTVAVRGKVVKFASNIMGKNWLHVQDGSGTAADGTNDLVVTSKETVKAGDVVTVKGVVNTDVDIGMGVKYPVLVEGATLQK